MDHYGNTNRNQPRLHGIWRVFLIVSQVKSKPKGNLAARGSFLIADEQRATAIGDHSPAKHRKGRNTIFYSELKGLLTCPKTWQSRNKKCDYIDVSVYNLPVASRFSENSATYKSISEIPRSLWVRWSWNEKPNNAVETREGSHRWCTSWWFQMFSCSQLLGKISNLTDILQMGWFNHQLV